MGKPRRPLGKNKNLNYVDQEDKMKKSMWMTRNHQKKDIWNQVCQMKSVIALRMNVIIVEFSLEGRKDQ